MLCEISPIDEASCSALAATDCTLAVVSLAAVAAESASFLDRSIAPSISPKFSSIKDFRLASNVIWAVMSKANFTTLQTLPEASRVGLYAPSIQTSLPLFATRLNCAA